MHFASLGRRPIIGVAAVVAAAFAAVPAFAQSAAQWPDRPVRLLVTVGAGGAADTLSRNLSNGFAQFANGQPLIVENRPGAGGTIAAAAVAREKPDGYTLFLAEVGPNAVSHTLTKLSYDPHTAFTPIIHAANLPAVVLIRPTLPYTTLAEFIAAAKQQPGKFNYASAGIGNWTHLFMAYLNSHAGIDQVNVVYRSGPGDADGAAEERGRHRDHHPFDRTGSDQGGQAPRSCRRLDAADAATAGNAAGRKNITATSTSASGTASPGRPAWTRRWSTRINGIFNQVLQVPAVRTAITQSQAADIIGGTPQQFDAFIKSELKRWPEVVKAAGIKPE